MQRGLTDFGYTKMSMAVFFVNFRREPRKLRFMRNAPYILHANIILMEYDLCVFIHSFFSIKSISSYQPHFACFRDKQFPRSPSQSPRPPPRPLLIYSHLHFVPAIIHYHSVGYITKIEIHKILRSPQMKKSTYLRSEFSLIYY